MYDPVSRSGLDCSYTTGARGTFATLNAKAVVHALQDAWQMGVVANYATSPVLPLTQYVPNYSTGIKTSPTESVDVPKLSPNFNLAPLLGFATLAALLYAKVQGPSALTLLTSR